MKLSFKWLTVPFSNATRQVEAVQMWNVRWLSRNGPHSSNTKPELECFTSEQEALAFKQAITQAFQLLKYSGEETSVKISKTA